MARIFLCSVLLLLLVISLKTLLPIERLEDVGSKIIHAVVNALVLEKDTSKIDGIIQLFYWTAKALFSLIAVAILGVAFYQVAIKYLLLTIFSVAILLVMRKYWLPLKYALTRVFAAHNPTPIPYDTK